MKFLISRLREPSSWAGISAIALAFGLNPEYVNAAAQVGIAISGAAAVFLVEKGDNES